VKNQRKNQKTRSKARSIKKKKKSKNQAHRSKTHKIKNKKNVVVGVDGRPNPGQASQTQACCGSAQARTQTLTAVKTKTAITDDVSTHSETLTAFPPTHGWPPVPPTHGISSSLPPSFLSSLLFSHFSLISLFFDSHNQVL
jgi:hypothetical protein